MSRNSRTASTELVTLDTYNSDLNLKIDRCKYSAVPLSNSEGFAFMWARVRATHGAASGKFCFEVKIGDHLNVRHVTVGEPHPHVVRVGFSVDGSSLELGEDKLSFGYGGSGRKVENGNFQQYGQKFNRDDVILAAVDMTGDLGKIGFAKNGFFQGWAFQIPKRGFEGKALFPHIMSKNTAFEVNFGGRTKPFVHVPPELISFRFIGRMRSEMLQAGIRGPTTQRNCEMITMCGLPGAGKTTWAMDRLKQRPELRYNVLGTNDIMDRMKVIGLLRERNYAGRWEVLIQMATNCLNKLIEIAPGLNRNYILDQTNVYQSARRRKLAPFKNFKHIAVVVVPSDAEYRRRVTERVYEEGKKVPESAVDEMKANFVLPSVDENFDSIIYTDLQRDAAEKLVFRYNKDAQLKLGKTPMHGSRQQNNLGSSRRCESLVDVMQKVSISDKKERSNSKASGGQSAVLPEQTRRSQNHRAQSANRQNQQKFRNVSVDGQGSRDDGRSRSYFRNTHGHIGGGQYYPRQYYPGHFNSGDYFHRNGFGNPGHFDNGAHRSNYFWPPNQRW